MGMTIDEAISDLIELKICGVVPFTKGTLSSGDYKVITDECLDEAIDIMRKYQQLKADYENRLKADMVAMLEEISLKFDEQYYVNRHELHDDSLNVGLEQGQSIIQQIIDALKMN